jgi:hypothetical protein
MAMRRITIEEAEAIQRLVEEIAAKNPWKDRGGAIRTKKIKKKKCGYGPLYIKAVLDDTIKDYEVRKQALREMTELIRSILPHDRLITGDHCHTRSQTFMLPNQDY